MAGDTSFAVKNSLVVNGAVVVNSTILALNSATITIGGALATNGQTLVANGTGAFAFGTPSTIGGANTQIQFNDSGGINGTSGLTFTKTSNTLTVANVVSVGPGGASANASVHTANAISVGNATINSIVTPATLTINSTPCGNAIWANTMGTANDYWANSAGKVMTVDLIDAAAAYTTLANAATVSWDMSKGINFTLQLTQNTTINFPTNIVVGRSGMLEIVQDATGGRTLSFAAGYHFPGGTPPTIANGASQISGLVWHARSSANVWVSGFGANIS
jgi:hypothetical protein